MTTSQLQLQKYGAALERHWGIKHITKRNAPQDQNYCYHATSSANKATASTHSREDTVLQHHIGIQTDKPHY
jgi:hypothetical protein